MSRIFAPLTDLISGALDLFHALGAPWWLSIAILTVVVRTLLFPLTLRQVRSMRAMQDLKPEIEELRRRYTDRAEQQAAMMELYRERRVNPLAGLLPILVQIPVFLTLYRVVRTHEQAFPSFGDGGLLWFTDLTRPDPYLILPILSASLVLAAGEISARNVEPQQRWAMRFLPVAFTAFIARFPAAMFVYWVTSNAMTLGQNLIVYRTGLVGFSSATAGDPAPAGVPEGPRGEPEAPPHRRPEKARQGARRRRRRKKRT